MRVDDQAPKYKIKEIVRFISTTPTTTYAGRTQLLCTYLKENIYGFFSCTDICKLFLSPTTQKISYSKMKCKSYILPLKTYGDRIFFFWSLKTIWQ